MRILLVGDRDHAALAHQGIDASLRRFERESGSEVRDVWPGTEAIATMRESDLDRFHGFWCVPASPYRSTEGALRAIRHARAADRPFLGTCGGFQHAILEFARNELGMGGAAHAELDAVHPDPLIAPLACSLVEESGSVRLDPRSRAAEWAGATELHEEYHCRFGLARSHRALFADRDLRIVGWDADGDARVVEHAGHPFFVATLFQPERRALREEGIHPLVGAFLRHAAAVAEVGPRAAHLAPSETAAPLAGRHPC